MLLASVLPVLLDCAGIVVGLLAAEHRTAAIFLTTSMTDALSSSRSAAAPGEPAAAATAAAIAAGPQKCWRCWKADSQAATSLAASASKRLRVDRYGEVGEVEVRWGGEATIACLSKLASLHSYHTAAAMPCLCSRSA